MHMVEHGVDRNILDLITGVVGTTIVSATQIVDDAQQFAKALKCDGLLFAKSGTIAGQMDQAVEMYVRRAYAESKLRLGVDLFDGSRCMLDVPVHELWQNIEAVHFVHESAGHKILIMLPSDKGLHRELQTRVTRLYRDLEIQERRQGQEKQAARLCWGLVRLQTMLLDLASSYGDTLTLEVRPRGGAGVIKTTRDKEGLIAEARKELVTMFMQGAELLFAADEIPGMCSRLHIPTSWQRPTESKTSSVTVGSAPEVASPGEEADLPLGKEPEEAPAAPAPKVAQPIFDGPEVAVAEVPRVPRFALYLWLHQKKRIVGIRKPPKGTKWFGAREYFCFLVRTKGGKVEAFLDSPHEGHAAVYRFKTSDIQWAREGIRTRSLVRRDIEGHGYCLGHYAHYDSGGWIRWLLDAIDPALHSQWEAEREQFLQLVSPASS